MSETPPEVAAAQPGATEPAKTFMSRLAAWEARWRVPAWDSEEVHRHDVRAHRGTREIVAFLLIVALGLAATFLFLSSTAAGEGWPSQSVPLDDNWIHLVYANNLAEHGAFYYSVGEVEAGMSSPFWVVVLAVPLLLGAAPVAAAKIASIVFGLLLPYVVYRLALRLAVPWGAALALGCFLAVEPNLSYARVSGMEVCLTATLIALALLSVLNERHVLTGLVFGLMVVTRAELVPVVALIAGAILLREYLSRDTLEALRRDELVLAVKLLLPPLILGGLWALLNFSVDGHFLPNTYYVKHDPSVGFFEPGILGAFWPGYFAFVGFLRGVHGVFVWLIAPIGVWILARTYGLRGLAVGVVPFVSTYILSTAVRMGPDYWNFWTRRYLDFTLPFFALLAVVALVFLWRWAGTVDVRGVALAAPLAVLLLVGGALWSSVPRFAELAEEHAWNCRNIAEVDVAMAKWLETNLPAGSLVGVTDAGAMRYFTPSLQVFDMLGLNDHRTIGRPLEEIMADLRPTHVVFFRTEWSDSLPYLHEAASFATERNTVLGGAELVCYQVDQTALPTLDQYFQALEAAE